MTLKVFELGAQNVHKKSILEKFRLGAKNIHEPPSFTTHITNTNSVETEISDQIRPTKGQCPLEGDLP